MFPFSLGTVHLAPKPRLQQQLEIIPILYCWDSYEAGYFDIQLGTQNFALIFLLRSGCSFLLPCYSGSTWLSGYLKHVCFQMCCEQRSRVQQQFSLSKPSLPVICHGHVSYVPLEKLLISKAM